jgi:hypothetical protein
MTILTPPLREMLERIEQAPEGYLPNETIRREGYYAVTAVQKLNRAGWIKAHISADPSFKYVLAWEITSAGRHALQMERSPHYQPNKEARWQR